MRGLTHSYHSYDSTFSTAGELSGAKNIFLLQTVGKRKKDRRSVRQSPLLL